MNKNFIKLILYLNDEAYKNNIIDYKKMISVKNKLLKEINKNEFNRY